LFHLTIHSAPELNGPAGLILKDPNLLRVGLASCGVEDYAKPDAIDRGTGFCPGVAVFV
jgi:hypothetical protein